MAQFDEMCKAGPYSAGGALVAGRSEFWRAVVDDGQLTIQRSGTVLDSASINTVQLDTPVLQRKLGTATLLQMNGNRWALDFAAGVKGNELSHEGAGAKVATMFGLNTRKVVRQSRETNRRFRSLLLAGGAVDLRG